MAKKKTSATRAGARPKPAKQPASASPLGSVAAQLQLASAQKVTRARKKFAQGVVARGEAVPAGQPLGPGVTHVIVGAEPDGTPRVERQRYSMAGQPIKAAPKKTPRKKK